MKLISDEDIAKQNMPLFMWGTREYLQTIRGISLGRKAQLEADQEVLDKTEKEAQEKVREIFEEIESWYVHTGIRIPQQLKPDIYEYNDKCEHCRLKALKQKWIKE